MRKFIRLGDRFPSTTISDTPSRKILAMKISISLPDELVRYLDGQVENRSQLIESLLRSWQWQQIQQDRVEACLALDGLDLGWGEEWEQAAVTDWEGSG